MYIVEDQQMHIQCPRAEAFSKVTYFSEDLAAAIPFNSGRFGKWKIKAQRYVNSLECSLKLIQLRLMI